jgi:diguanylate cyclase (GGDEF)-like protein
MTGDTAPSPADSQSAGTAWPTAPVVAAATGWAAVLGVLYAWSGDRWENLLFAVAVVPPVTALLVPLVRRHPARPWMVLVAGTGVLATADSLEGVVDAGGLESLNLTDIGYFVGYGLFAVGLWLLARAHGRQGGRAGVVDGLVMLVPAVVLLVEYVLGSGTPGSTWTSRAVVAGFVMADLVVIALITWLIATPAYDRAHLGLLLVGFAITLAGDLLLGIELLEPGSPWLPTVEALYPLTYALIAAGVARGATTGLRAEPRTVVHWGRIGLLAMGAVMAPLTVAFAAAAPGNLRVGPVAVTAVAAAATIVVRMVDLARHLERTTGELHEARRELEQLATHDPLTGLHNRAVLEELLGALSDRSTRPAALLSIDLDRFKAVNDVYGHAAGDAVLEAVARRMRAVLRADDALVRMGGDEFLAVLRAVPRTEVDRLAARLVLAVQEPVEFRGHSLEVSASVGVALLPADRMLPAEDDAMARADAAMYLAKRAGPGQVVTDSPTDRPAGRSTDPGVPPGGTEVDPGPQEADRRRAATVRGHEQRSEAAPDDPGAGKVHPIR